LEGTLDIPAIQQLIRAALSSPDLMAALPVGRVIAGLSVRLQPQGLLDSSFTVAFDITDLDAVYALEVRRGVAQFHDNDGFAADTRLITTRASIMKLLLGQVSLQQARDAGEIDVAGDEGALTTFLSALEGPAPIYLTIR
ncbi:MAG: hypothetical protein OER92_12190, partial [Alphaproteobacteria bacterium]|nr:hypothetical protein [Alphaproteobacteria bacterium]